MNRESCGPVDVVMVSLNGVGVVTTNLLLVKFESSKVPVVGGNSRGEVRGKAKLAEVVGCVLRDVELELKLSVVKLSAPVVVGGRGRVFSKVVVGR